MKYEIIQSKHWYNVITHQTASIYGAVPYVSEKEKQNWIIKNNGYTLLNTLTGIVGIGKKPFKTYQDAVNFLNRV